MAGGAGDPGLTDSILEVPTFTIALVFAFFLLVSILFEKGVHWLSHYFEKMGRLGLVEALQKLTIELTTMGLVSLILITFQSSLSGWCVGYSSSISDWTLMQNIQGCPCCLETTAGVSTCAQIAHGCQWNGSEGGYSPYCGCGNTHIHDAADDCYTYTEAERLFFMDQVPAGVGLIAELIKLNNSSAATEDICDVFCEIVNTTLQEYDGGKPGKDAMETVLGGHRRLHGLAPDGCSRGCGGRALLGGGPAYYEQGFVPGEGLRLPRRQPQLQPRLGAGGLWAGPGAAPQPPARRPPRPMRRLQASGVAELDEELLASLLELADQANWTSSKDTKTYIVPKFKTFKCTGPFLAGSCKDGKVPFISNEALHQIHIWVFLIAVTHVVVSILMIIVSGYRLRQWRKWQVQIWKEEGELEADEDSISIPAPAPPAANGAGASKAANGSAPASPEQPSSPAAAGAAGLEGGQVAARGELGHWGAGAGAGEVGPLGGSGGSQSAAGGGGHPAAASKSFGSNPSGADAEAGSGSPPLERQLSRQASMADASWRLLRRKWGRRDTVIRSHTGHWVEVWTCLAQAFMPNAVRRHQFLMIRSAWIACTDPPQPFDFVSHMLNHQERDAARIVGLSVEMWLVVIVWVLLSGVVNWSGSLFMWGAALLLLLVNVALVAMLRYACRGSQPSLEPRHRGKARLLLGWLRADLLLIPIRMVLFLCSLLYSTTIFLAWQFGGKSCFFDETLDLWTTVPGLPWWTGLVAASIILAYVTLVTLPIYSLAVHATHAHEDEEEEEVEHLPTLARAKLRQMSLMHQASHQRSQMEVSALQAENQRLRKMLSAGTSPALETVTE